MKKIFLFLFCLGLLGWAPSAARAFTGGICPNSQECWYVSYVCDSCSSDLRCQTPDIGVNPRYVQGITSGNNCAQNDYCYNDKNDHDKLVCAEVNVNGQGWTSSGGSVKLGDSVQFRAQPAGGRTALFLNNAGLTGRQCSSDVGAGKVFPGGPVTIDSWWGNAGQNISVKAFQFGSNWWTSSGGSCEDSLNLTIMAAPTPTPTPTPTLTPIPDSTPTPTPTATPAPTPTSFNF